MYGDQQNVKKACVELNVKVATPAGSFSEENRMTEANADMGPCTVIGARASGTGVTASLCASNRVEEAKRNAFVPCQQSIQATNTCETSFDAPSGSSTEKGFPRTSGQTNRQSTTTYTTLASLIQASDRSQYASTLDRQTGRFRRWHNTFAMNSSCEGTNQPWWARRKTTADDEWVDEEYLDRPQPSLMTRCLWWLQDVWYRLTNCFQR